MNQSILCGIDSSQVSHRAARVAAALAKELDHRLVLAHIAHDAPTFPYRYWDRRQRELHRRDATRDAAAMLQRVAATLPEIAPETRVVFGEPAEALTAIARDEEASVLIVGSRGRGTWQAAALGTVSGALAATAPVPVLVVPPSARLPRLAEDVVHATVKDVLHRARRRTMHRSHQAIETDHTRAQIAADRERVGRFSQGIEQLPETPAELRQGRFSDGIERLPASPDELHRRRFSEGIEQLSETAATRRRGSFADGYEQISPPRSNAA